MVKLTIDLPDNTIKEFEEYIKTLGGDSKLAFQLIWESFKQNIKLDYVLSELEEIKARLTNLEQPAEKIIKSLSGRIISRRGGRRE